MEVVVLVIVEWLIVVVESVEIDVVLSWCCDFEVGCIDDVVDFVFYIVGDDVFCGDVFDFFVFGDVDEFDVWLVEGC